MRHYYSKGAAEVVDIVDTNGSLYSNAHAYDPRLCHGNSFEESLQCMKASENYRQAVAGACGRMGATCTGCRFHGACSAHFMGEANPEERGYDEEGRLECGIARPAQDYIEETRFWLRRQSETSLEWLPKATSIRSLFRAHVLA